MKDNKNQTRDDDGPRNKGKNSQPAAIPPGNQQPVPSQRNTVHQPAAGFGPTREFPADLPELVEPMPKWCIGFDVPIYTADNSIHLVKLNPGNQVSVRRHYQFPDEVTIWSEIIYISYTKIPNRDAWEENIITGWVNDTFLDDFIKGFPDSGPENTVLISHPTNDPTDAKQYMLLDADKGFESVVRTNMCGELCAAFILGRGIDAAVENWKKNPRSLYWSSLGKGQNKETGADELIEMLTANFEASGTAIGADHIVKYFDPKKPVSKPTSPEKMKDGLVGMIGAYFLMFLVRIDHSFGVLIKKGLPGDDHWVVLDRLNGNRVELYNPFLNRREEYTINELYDSNEFVGVWVKRPAGNGLVSAGMVKPGFDVPLDAPKQPGQVAEQFILREGGIKHDLCGEFCVTYILGKSVDASLAQWKPASMPGYREIVTVLGAYGYHKDTGLPRSFTIGTVLDYWREVQPQLYNKHVVLDKPTGAAQLITLLKAYGYATAGDFVDFRAGLTDNITGQYLPSPGRMKEKLEKYFLIAGVGIDGVSGRLIDNDKAVRHWVVVESISPTGKHFVDPDGRRSPIHSGGSGGWVELYNPFTNIREEYSYMEFTNSMSPTGAWYGLWVKRAINPVFLPQSVVTVVDDEDGGKGKHNGRDVEVVKKWPDSKMAEEIAKRGKNKTPDQVLASLVKEKTGWGAAEIARLLPGQKKVESAFDVEKLLIDNLQVSGIHPEVVSWFRAASKTDASLAVKLAGTMRNAGILSIVEKEGKVRQVEFSEAALSNSARAVNDSQPAARAAQITQKVASLVLPLLTPTIAQEIKTLRSV